MVSTVLDSMPSGLSESSAVSNGVPKVLMVKVPPLMVTRGSGSSASVAVSPSSAYQDAVIALS
jgi:hypothetical protein